MDVKDKKIGKRECVFLSHLQVLDLADEKADFCSMLLADLGADVIKLERPGREPNPRNPNHDLSYLYHNFNKRRITLDLSKKKGRGLFLRLLKRSDVIVESFAPPGLAKWELEYERLKTVNPDIIHASVTDFGPYGPRAKYKSGDLVTSAFGGHMGVTGTPKGTPLRLYGNQSYYAASLFAACAILLAVHKRKKIGKGEHIEITLHEAVTSTLEHVMVRYFAEKFIPERKGSDHWDDLFFVLPCKDGFIQMTVFQNWETLIELLIKDGACGDLDEEKWENEEYRMKNKDHVLLILAKWTSRYTQHELFEMGQLMRFPWAPVQKPDEIFSCPHLKARGFFNELNYEGRTIPFPGLPFRLTAPMSKRKDFFPSPGEHNLHVYRDELGISEIEIKKLASMGVI